MNLYKMASVTHTFRAVSKLTIRILKTVQTLFFISLFISRLFNSYIYIHMYAATRIALHLCILHNNNPLLYINNEGFLLRVFSY